MKCHGDVDATLDGSGEYSILGQVAAKGDTSSFASSEIGERLVGCHVGKETGFLLSYEMLEVGDGWAGHLTLLKELDYLLLIDTEPCTDHSHLEYLSNISGSVLKRLVDVVKVGYFSAHCPGEIFSIDHKGNLAVLWDGGRGHFGDGTGGE